MLPLNVQILNSGNGSMDGQIRPVRRKDWGVLSYHPSQVQFINNISGSGLVWPSCWYWDIPRDKEDECPPTKETSNSWNVTVGCCTVDITLLYGHSVRIRLPLFFCFLCVNCELFLENLVWKGWQYFKRKKAPFKSLLNNNPVDKYKKGMKLIDAANWKAI